MGLKADIDEVLTSWEKSPWWLKAWLVLSAFLAISSIASIAEAIVKWKGFFRDAIDFYKTFLVAPIRDFLSALTIHIDPARSEVLVLIVAGFMIHVRYFYITERNNPKLRQQMSALILIFILLLVLWIYRANGNHESINWTRNIVGLLGGMVVIPLVLKYEKPALYFGQWLVFFSIVGLMAAINSGLSK